MWNDITPIPQDDGPQPLVAIAYPPTYRQLMDVFRGVVRVEERSERALHLTEELLAINAANYTVWQYRRECLRALSSSFITSELDFLDTFAEDNPKNYQLWHHRRVIVEMLGDASREKEFTGSVFEVDAKNYHAWSHRQWVVSAYDLWTGEMEFAHQLLLEDVRNNSAWNHRWYVTHNNPELPISAETITTELNYAFAAISTVTENESAWNYVRGYVSKHRDIAEKFVLEKLVAMEQVGGLAENIFRLEILADIWETSQESIGRAIGVFNTLKEQRDVMRAKYWEYRVNQCTSRMQEVSA